MKPFLVIITLAFGFTSLNAQTESEPEAPKKELLDWEKGFLNLSEESRVEHVGHVAKSRELFGQKRIFECIEELEKAREIYPDTPDIENLLGACQVEFRSFEKAMEHFKRADKLQPGSQSIQFNIAEIYFVTKQWEEAEKVFTEMVQDLQAEEVDFRNLSMTRLVEFKLMVTKIKLGKMDEAKTMAALYDHLDDSPYHYYAEAAIAYHEGRELEAEAAMARASRIFRNPATISPWQDTMMESGYVKSFFGGDIPEEE